MRNLWTGAAALALTVSGAMPAAAQALRGEVETQMPSLMAIYKDLHAHPELSFMEVRSAGILAAEARKLGFKVTEKVGGTGVVAVMENGPGPVVMVRADMDGLPVTEQTGLPGASKVRVTTKEGVETGVMHACGHDTHMTAWIGVARLMAANKDKWSGTLVMIGQPAEERGAGARMMLEDGLYTRFPKPEYVLAFHDAAQFPAGKIGYTPGYALANVDSVDILVKGVGGHGAYPQATKDPIVLGSRIVGALQTLVSREVSPLDSAVVTVGSFHAGAKHNIISDEARLQLTVRSYTDAVRDHLLDGIARIARGEAIAAGIPEDRMPVVSVQKDEYTPATFNTPEFTEGMAAFLKTNFGDERVVKMPPVMGGEDFGRFGREDKSIKSLIIWVGGVPQPEYDAAKKEGRTLPSLHSPFWAPDAPAVISTATEALTAMTMKLMGKK
ncbi:Peptidase M20D, amidohydrolase [uncultured Sphingopyxis sp.]|uniref:Peptidase M20D, amidohydrolase n=1 Tax=uncultured Sphingopyxis sp. TaxID=310581 RepID=A0A1Y5Q0J7_9SPHN|nr:amidohydrolase [uncultured Sphingopyxis sp.]SBV33297.1 Peptidase M20D, amidohydrolase [uncultured Sphingopyxis sp.]